MELKEQILEEYCSNEMQKLKQICYPKISKIGGISQMDYDDLYSIALYVLRDSVERYDDETCKFSTFLSNNIQYKFDTYVRDRNRRKRSNTKVGADGQIVYLPNISIDAPTEDGVDLAEKVASSFNIDDVVSKEMGFSYGEKTEEYLASLSSEQTKIARLIMTGFTSEEIKRQLRLTDKEYSVQISAMRSYEKRRILFKESNIGEEEVMGVAGTLMEDVTETFKNTSYSIESISKQLQKKRIRDDHILQRHSGQWKGFAKSELISDILRGKSLTQIIISEEIKDGVRMQWLIDGKQRCTTLDDYLHDGFAISKNVKNYNIRYQVAKVDEDGNELLNDEGFPMTDFKVFDIRGKKFSKLPEELQDIFKDRQIPVLYNMNCTKKDIADDIARFNRSRPMTKAQNGWLGLDESFAEFVENIVKMPFFQPDFVGSTYTNGNHTSGIIRRVVVEAIMVSDFIEEFGDFDRMCEFLSEEASDSNFTEFYSLIERLTNVCNGDSVAKLFDAKDSFLWFGLFSRFTTVCEDDTKFIEFMAEFARSLHSKEIDGVSFDDLNGKSTKDKTIVLNKMTHLMKLLNDYLHIEEQTITEDDSETNLVDFVKTAVDSTITVQDIELYKEVFEDLTLNVDNNSKLLEPSNRASFIALIAYSFAHDIDLDNWIIEYFDRYNIYEPDQNKNYLHMVENLQAYISNKSLLKAV